MDPNDGKSGVSRREVVQLIAATGAAVMLSNVLRGADIPPTTQPSNALNVAIIGIGRQGKVLLDLALKIPGLRFVAICDIWTYSQKIAAGMCKEAGMDVKIYDDYREMLATEKDLQAVIVATPDFWHAPITNDCLKAGLNVYCEKEMSNTLEGAKSMVLTARQTGKLLQIGHQRRSNPYYEHAYNLLHIDEFCGTPTTVNGQWNQLKPLRPFPAKLGEKYPIPPATLAKWGFGSMSEFYEWRWFYKYQAGPMANLGSHQVDVFNWFLDALPTKVSAIGGVEWALAQAKEHKVGFTPNSFDMTLATYQWNTEWGLVRGIYQVNLTTSYGGFYEVFMGDRATMVTSEIIDKAAMYREASAEPLPWEDDAEKFKQGGLEVMHFDPLKSRNANGKMDEETKTMIAAMNKPAHQPHLENFFDAVRSGGKVKLNCPPDVAYTTAVSVMRAHEAALSGTTIDFKPEEFKV